MEVIKCKHNSKFGLYVRLTMNMNIVLIGYCVYEVFEQVLLDYFHEMERRILDDMDKVKPLCCIVGC